MSLARILLVDDDPQGLESARKILELEGWEVVVARDGREALDRAQSQTFNAVVTDVRMPRMGGIDFLRALSVLGKQIPVILMTAFGQVDEAVWAMKLGAVDFLTKPFKRSQLVDSVTAALERSRPSGVLDGVQQEILGESLAISELRMLAQQVAVVDVPVLITGESGSGKEKVAQQIHRQSARAQKALVALNCTAIPESLIESELFGHVKGAFTGATQDREGLFQAADQGTLFLDEIGDMPLTVQAKLLRVLETGEVRRVGATESERVDVRILSATHRNLTEEVKAGRFREDLLYRLEVITLVVPPLRERGGDIALLAHAFLARAAARMKKSFLGVSPEAMILLNAHTWPGNVRELSNVMERAAVFCREGYVLPEHLPQVIQRAETSLRATSTSRDELGVVSIPVGTPLADVKDLLIQKTIESTGGDVRLAANLLGISERTIYRQKEKD